MNTYRDPLADHPRFKKIRNLNSGTFGFVQMAVELKTGLKVAIKFLPRGPGINECVLKEILNHRLLSKHPLVVEFREVFLTPYHMGICMEYCQGGDLFEYLNRHNRSHTAPGLPEHYVQSLFQQLIVALDFAHELGVANRDIKLENVLLAQRDPHAQVRLCDFGYSSNEFLDPAATGLSGTPDYIAPEVLKCETHDGKKADIWSAGVLLYVLLTGCLPFTHAGDPDSNSERLAIMTPRIVAGECMQPEHLTPMALHLVNRMMTVDPAQRITLAQIKAHPWFQDNLPAQLKEMNFDLLQNLGLNQAQTVKEIEELCNQAKKPDLTHMQESLFPWER
ncbi:hypothetical protein WJX73_000668 [Symbiochloris irregularis]|uniref:Protein kinase domain-containing protein n=1 Tax=Symbiochloris irregularis TaxID=706552 RepID=A0AAW1NSZ6_9CHLO